MYKTFFILFCDFSRKTSNNTRFDTTFVLSSEHLEQTLLTPIFIPRVSNKPIGSVIFSTPTNNLDRVTTFIFQLRVSDINTTAISEEIGRDLERSLNRTVLQNFSLDSFDTAGNRVSLRSVTNISSVSRSVVRIALLDTLGSGLNGTTRLILTNNVMIARRENVWLASSGIIVKSTSDNTSILEVRPSSTGVTTLTTVTT